MGTFEVRMTDAPADYDEVNVHIESVEVNRDESGEDEADGEGWMTISEPNQTYNLLELTNGAYTVLGETSLEAGTYHQIRLILSEAGHSVVVNGEQHDMFVPSGAQTGVKLNVDAQIEEDITYTLLLDFDASRSVVKRGQGAGFQGFLLKPVIQASNLAVTGNIDGTVSPVEAAPVVYAIAGEDTVASTYANEEDGYFKLIGLEEGSYTVSINPTNEDFVKKDTSNIAVSVGETNEIGTVKLEQVQ
ncbi:MAG: DUF4382 domain-containing protein [Balneolaceae bacterium]|nr:DUF4382 domain-containing protein [Balneolaceae bacterium]